MVYNRLSNRKTILLISPNCPCSGRQEVVQYNYSDVSSDSITMEQDAPKNVTSFDCSFKESVCVQTETSWIQEAAKEKEHRSKLEEANLKLRQENISLRQKLAEAELATRYSVSTLEFQNKKCKYITGISSGVLL